MQTQDNDSLKKVISNSITAFIIHKFHSQGKIFPQTGPGSQSKIPKHLSQNFISQSVQKIDPFIYLVVHYLRFPIRFVNDLFLFLPLGKAQIKEDKENLKR